MKVFRDLYLTGNDEALEAVVDIIERSLTHGWQRDREAERRSRAMVVSNRATYCFSCEPNGDRPSALLVLMEKDGGSLSVTNIVPREAGNLTHDQYNSILEEFVDEFARPAAAKTGVTVNLTPAEKGIENWLSPDAAKKLRSFSSLANKSTGSAHSQDRQLWFEFLLATHQERSPLDSTTLTRWFCENERWNDQVANELAIEYEFGRELLKFADRHRACG